MRDSIGFDCQFSLKMSQLDRKEGHMLSLSIKVKVSNSKPDIYNLIKQKYRLTDQEIISFSIIHQSLDLRSNYQPNWLFLISLELSDEKEFVACHPQFQIIEKKPEYSLPLPGSKCLSNPIVVVGFGPCGMAAALALAIKGYRPIVIERGAKIEERKQIVDDYWHHATALDLQTNVQFGEGGAGAFSDGKLTTRIKDYRVGMILQQLIKFGADPQIAYYNHPHLGTDNLYKINQAIRDKIIQSGGQILFNTRLDQLHIKNNQLESIDLSNGHSITTNNLILAIGHSARDTFKMLVDKQIPLVNKPFAVGVRIEHLQSYINERQYRMVPDYSNLPSAEYRLAYNAKNHKGVYSFCMCPGGYVVAGESEPETIVTNGMSYASRDGINANSALVVQVDASDYGDDLLAGVAFQRNLEHQAYLLGQGKAPIQTVGNYLDSSKHNKETTIHPTYPRGVNYVDLHRLFPGKIDEPLKEMLLHTEKIMPGFTKNGALITAVETRTSSPIRFLRDSLTLESPIEGLYPAGEGAGYSGGIVSSAIDGLKCAEKIIASYQIPSNDFD